MSGAAAAMGRVAGTVLDDFAAIWRELTTIGFADARARTCTIAALSVIAAVVLAQSAGFADVWWAAISGLMSSQATRPASIERAIVRIFATALSALLACAAMSLFAYDQVGLCLFLLVGGTIGVLGMSISTHGYAWMFGGLTANLIVMMAMNDPAQTPLLAFDRMAQVTLGCIAAALVAQLLAPEGGQAAGAAAPGWTDVLGAGWPAVQHAVRSGVTIMMLPVIWNLFNLPNLTQMAVSVTAVMAVPVLATDPSLIRGIVAARSAMRIIGCLWGGVFGLLCIATPLASYYPAWLALLFAGVWLCVRVQTGDPQASYAGVQAGIVFIVTMVQGNGPPSSIMPGIDRFVGIVCGLAVLLLMAFVLWPAPRVSRAPP